MVKRKRFVIGFCFYICGDSKIQKQLEALQAWIWIDSMVFVPESQLLKLFHVFALFALQLLPSTAS